MSPTYQINRRLERKKHTPQLWFSCPIKIVTLQHAMQALRRGRGTALLICNLDASRGWMVSAMPWPLNPHAATLYPSYRRLGGPQSQPGKVQKSHPCRGSNSRPPSPQSVTIPTTLPLFCYLQSSIPVLIIRHINTDIKYTMMCQSNTTNLYYVFYCIRATCFDSYRIICRPF